MIPYSLEYVLYPFEYTDDIFEDNNTVESAANLVPGIYDSLKIAVNDMDFFTLVATEASVWIIDLNYVRTFFDANNTVEIAQLSSVSVVNLSVGYEPASADWGLNFGVVNATDEIYATGGNSSLTTGSGYAEIAYARPREYFVGFTNSF